MVGEGREKGLRHINPGAAAANHRLAESHHGILQAPASQMSRPDIRMSAMFNLPQCAGGVVSIPRLVAVS